MRRGIKNSTISENTWLWEGDKRASCFNNSINCFTIFYITLTRRHCSRTKVNVSMSSELLYIKHAIHWWQKMRLFLNTQITTIIIGHSEEASLRSLRKGLIFHSMAVTQHLQPCVLTLAVIFLQDNRPNCNIRNSPATVLTDVAVTPWNRIWEYSVWMSAEIPVIILHFSPFSLGESGVTL